MKLVLSLTDDSGKSTEIFKKNINVVSKNSLESSIGATSTLKIDLTPIEATKHITVEADGKFDLLCVDQEGNEIPVLRDCDGYSGGAFSKESLTYEISGNVHIGNHLLIRNKETRSLKTKILILGEAVETL